MCPMVISMVVLGYFLMAMIGVGGAGLEEISDKVIRDKVLRNIYRWSVFIYNDGLFEGF